MRHRFLVASAVLAVGGGCGTAAAPSGGPRGTVRMFEGQRVVGRYVSPSAYEHYLRAQLADQAGQREVAAEELALAVTSDGASAFLRTRLGAELLSLGRLDEGRESLEAALRFDPEFADAHVELARLALRRGDTDGAEARLRRALELDRGCEEAYLALAQLYRGRGDLGHAERVWQSMAERVPQSAAAHLQLSRSAVARGDLKAAESELRSAQRLDPSSLATQLELGRLLLSQERPLEAERELRAALERTGRDPRVAELLVQVLVASGRSDEADALVEPLDMRGGPRERQLAVGWLLLSRQKPERAMAVADALLAGSEMAAARLLLGTALARLRRVDDAVGELARVPPESSEFALAQMRIGRTLADAGRVREAIELLTGAAGRLAGRAEGDAVAALLSELCERSGDRARARAVLDEALRLRPESEELACALAGLFDRGGEADRAIGLVLRVLSRSPDNPEALNFIGWSLADRGVRLPEAQRYLERARALRPTSGEIADSLGWLYLKLDRIDDSVRLLEQASRLMPDAADVLAHLGDAYLRRQDRPRALAVYRQALAQGPEPRVRQAVEQRLLHLEEGRVGAR